MLGGYHDFSVLRNANHGKDGSLKQIMEVATQMSHPRLNGSAPPADALEFAEIIGGAADARFGFGMIHPGGAGADRPGGCLSMHEAYSILADANNSGAGIYAMPNASDGRGQSAINIIGVRCLSVDLDGAPIGPVLEATLRPNLIVETSAGRYQAFWCADDIPLDRFRDLQEALIKRYGGDASVKDLSRLMRLPGFYHTKGSPFLSRIVHRDKCEIGPHSYDDLCTEYLAGREVGAPAPAGVSIFGSLPDPRSVDECKAIISTIDPTRYEDWATTVIAGTSHQFNGTEHEDEMIAFLEDWSADSVGSPQVRGKWESFARAPGVPTTFASVAALAAKQGANLSTIARTSNTAEALNQDGSINPLNYVHMLDTEKFYNLTTKLEITKTALNDHFLAVHGNPKAAHVLLTSPDKLYADTRAWMPVRYKELAPGEEKPSPVIDQGDRKVLNLFKGWDLTPMPGDVKPYIELLEFLYGSASYHILQRMAADVQYPERANVWNIILGGLSGTGKGALLKVYSKIFGGSHQTITNADMGAGWGDFFQGKKVIVADEMHDLSGPMMEKFKAMTANDGRELMLNEKWGGISGQVCAYSWWFSTNNPGMADITADDRRLWPLWTTKKLEGSAFLEETAGPWLDHPDSAAWLFHYLLNMDLSDYNHHIMPPPTEGRRMAIAEARPENHYALDEYLADGLHGFSDGLVSVTSLLIALCGRTPKKKKHRQEVRAWLMAEGWVQLPKPQKKGERPLSSTYWAPRDSDMTSMSSVELWEYLTKKAKNSPFRAHTS